MNQTNVTLGLATEMVQLICRNKPVDFEVNIDQESDGFMVKMKLKDKEWYGALVLEPSQFDRWPDMIRNILSRVLRGGKAN